MWRDICDVICDVICDGTGRDVAWRDGTGRDGAGWDGMGWDSSMPVLHESLPNRHVVMEEYLHSTEKKYSSNYLSVPKYGGKGGHGK